MHRMIENKQVNVAESDKRDCVKADFASLAAEHVALARSRTWNAGDPWHFIAYCRLLLGLPEDGPAPYRLIDQAMTSNANPYAGDQGDENDAQSSILGPLGVDPHGKYATVSLDLHPDCHPTLPPTRPSDAL